MKLYYVDLIKRNILYEKSLNIKGLIAGTKGNYQKIFASKNITFSGDEVEKF